MRCESRTQAWIVAASALAFACGNTSGPVLERIEPRVPPEFTHRVDVFLVSVVENCAVGRPCASADPRNCFYVRSPSSSVEFEPASVEFVAPGDPRIDAAAQSACFRLELDSASQDAAAQRFSALRADIFQLSAGTINLDVRLHVVASEPSELKRWEGGSGIFLQPTSLESNGLALMSPDSDFVFAVTGESDETLGTLPKIDPCGGTNWQAQGGLGGAAYTWLSASCLATATLRWHWLYQAYFAMRDVVGFDGVYADAYPECGQGVADVKRWFPRPSDCAVDPDAASCGRADCDEQSFAAHVLTAHWPSAPGLVGNHCRNGRTDYDETSPDAGGVCDALGR